MKRNLILVFTAFFYCELFAFSAQALNSEDLFVGVGAAEIKRRFSMSSAEFPQKKEFFKGIAENPQYRMKDPQNRDSLLSREQTVWSFFAFVDQMREKTARYMATLSDAERDEALRKKRILSLQEQVNFTLGCVRVYIVERRFPKNFTAEGYGEYLVDELRSIDAGSDRVIAKSREVIAKAESSEAEKSSAQYNQRYAQKQQGCALVWVAMITMNFENKFSKVPCVVNQSEEVRYSTAWSLLDASQAVHKRDFPKILQAYLVVNKGYTPFRKTREEALADAFEAVNGKHRLPGLNMEGGPGKVRKERAKAPPTSFPEYETPRNKPTDQFVLEVKKRVTQKIKENNEQGADVASPADVVIAQADTLLGGAAVLATGVVSQVAIPPANLFASPAVETVDVMDGSAAALAARDLFPENEDGAAAQINGGMFMDEGADITAPIDDDEEDMEVDEAAAVQSDSGMSMDEDDDGEARGEEVSIEGGYPVELTSYHKKYIRECLEANPDLQMREMTSLFSEKFLKKRKIFSSPENTPSERLYTKINTYLSSQKKKMRLPEIQLPVVVIEWVKENCRGMIRSKAAEKLARAKKVPELAPYLEGLTADDLSPLLKAQMPDDFFPNKTRTVPKEVKACIMKHIEETPSNIFKSLQEDPKLKEEPWVNQLNTLRNIRQMKTRHNQKSKKK